MAYLDTHGAIASGGRGFTFLPLPHYRGSDEMRKSALLLVSMALALLLADGTALASIGGLDVELSPDSETRAVYSEHTVTARITNDIMGPVPTAKVTFEISGPSGTSSFETSTDGNGEAFLTFDSGLAATYTISATAEHSRSGQTLRGESNAPVTVTFIDETRPTIVGSGLAPARGATRVARDTDVMAAFSEPMNRETLTASTFKLYRWNETEETWNRVSAKVAYRWVDCSRFASTCEAVPQAECEVTWENGEVLRRLTCEVPTLDAYPSDPSRLLAARKKYKAVITTGVRDVNALALAKVYAWTFTTGRR